MSNGYHDGLACEHRFLDETFCFEPAAFIVGGMALCESHFEDLVTAASLTPHGTDRAADLRFAARPVPPRTVPQADGDSR